MLSPEEMFITGKKKVLQRKNGIAVLSTFDPVDPSAQVANSGGNITTDGGSGISSRGVCWSTSPNPTILDSKTVDGTGTGVFYLRNDRVDTQHYLLCQGLRNKRV